MRTPHLFLVASLALSTGCKEPVAHDTADPIEDWELTWLGVTSWLVRSPDTTLLLDPYFSRPGLAGPNQDGLDLLIEVLDAAGVDRVDGILVGHSHFDHAVDVGPAALHTGATVFGSATTCLIAAAGGVSGCSSMTQGDHRTLRDVRFKTARTIHFSPDSPIGAHGVYEHEPRPDDAGSAPHGGVLTFVIEVDDGPRIVFQDSMGPLDGDDGSGEDYAANLATLGTGGAWLSTPTFLEDADQVNAYASVLQPDLVVPQHWDGTAPPLNEGLTTPLDAEGWVPVDVELTEYFTTFRYSDAGWEPTPDQPVRAAFGL